MSAPHQAENPAPVDVGLPNIYIQDTEVQEDYPEFARRGFEVMVEGNQYAHATVYEDAMLDRKDSGEPVLEHGVIELNFVNVPPELSGAGVGAKLVQEALKHSADTGHEIGRGHLLNSRMLRIMQRMQGEGIISDLVFVAAPSHITGENPKASVRETLQRPQMSIEEAQEVLSIDVDDDGFSNGPGVEMIFSINRQPQLEETEQLAA